MFAFYDLSTKVGRFLSDFGGHASAENMYVIWIGANDFDDALNALALGRAIDNMGPRFYSRVLKAL